LTDTYFSTLTEEATTAWMNVEEKEQMQTGKHNIVETYTCLCILFPILNSNLH